MMHSILDYVYKHDLNSKTPISDAEEGIDTAQLKMQLLMKDHQIAELKRQGWDSHVGHEKLMEMGMKRV